MSTSAITSSLLSTVLKSSYTANQFGNNLNQLAKDLKSGNLSAAQGDYVTLSQDLRSGAGSSSANTSSSGITVSLLSTIAGSSSSLSNFTNTLNQLGTDLSSGSASSAQQDLLSLDSTALNASATTTGSSASNPAITVKPQTGGLISAIVQAIRSGNTSGVSTGLAQLASVSSSAEGASYLKQLSSNYGSGSSPTSSVTSALQTLNTNSASPYLSLLG